MLTDDKINYRMLAMLLQHDKVDPDYGGEGYSDDYFPLLAATKKNDYRSVQMLLEAGADPNLRRDLTPLVLAIKNRNMSIVKLLVSAGADVNLQSNYPECRALDLAKKVGSFGLMQYLKSKGAKELGYCQLSA